MTLYSKGLAGVPANESAISLVDGKNAKLSYRGYDIEDLVLSCSFEEIIYLLHCGDLPNAKKLEEIRSSLAAQRKLPETVIKFIKDAPKDAIPMDILRTAISMLGVFERASKAQAPEELYEKSLAIIAQASLIIAFYHCLRNGKEFPEPKDELGEAENFLYLINQELPTDRATKFLDSAYILHADHGTNASTFASRVTISTLTDLHSALTASVGSLKGPLHGGANEGVIRMLREIGELENVESYVEEKLAKKEKIMGIGHRVYKTTDPRVHQLRKMAIELTQELGEPKWVQMSERIAQIMEERKGLSPNVDLYSATVYYSLGIPIDLFVPIFAIARMSGWTAQIREQLSDNRLYRPATIYNGKTNRGKIPQLCER